MNNIEARINHLNEWLEYLKSKNYDDLTPTQQKDLIVLEDVIKDLRALETLVINSAIVIEGDNRYFKTSIKEYDYLRRPVDDFDRVKYLIEK